MAPPRLIDMLLGSVSPPPVSSLCRKATNWIHALADRMDQLVGAGDPDSVESIAEALGISFTIGAIACSQTHSNPPPEIGRAVGAGVATVGVAAAGAPELAPIAAPIGAAAGELVEREITRRL